MLNFSDRLQPLAMLWPNMNWLSMLWKKLARVKECVIVYIFGGLPRTGRFGSGTLY